MVTAGSQAVGSAALTTAPRYIGQSVARKEDRRLLTGHGEYVDDVSVPDLWHVAFVRSPVAAARLISVETRAASQLEGVLAVFTAADLNSDAFEMKTTFEMIMGTAAPTREVFASQRLKYVGDPIAMVVARSRAIAEDAAELVDVAYEETTPVLDYELAPDASVLVHEEMGTNVASDLSSEPSAALDAAFENAAYVVDETIHQHRYMNVPMETRGLVASWSVGREEMTFWAATQLPHEFRNSAARLLNVPQSRVHVIAGDVGGGFGQKAYVAREESAVLLASKRLGKPLKWIEDRSENLVAANHARQERIRVRMAFDEKFRITAAALDHLEDMGALPATGTALITGFKACQMFPGPYRMPLLGFRTRMVWTNTCGRLSYRGPWMIETVARETMMDVAARRFGIDPLELRRRNTIAEADLPHTTVTGMVYDRMSIERTLDLAAHEIGYVEFRKSQEEGRRSGRLVGIGLSHCVEPTAGTGAHFSIEAANIKIQPSGDVDVFLGTGNHGQGTETTMAQIVADTLGVPYTTVAVHDGNTDASPFGGGSAGSRTAVIAGAACHKSAEELRLKVMRLAAHMLEAAEEDLIMEEGVISVRGSPDRPLPLASVAHLAYHNAGGLPPGMEPGLETTVRHAAEGATYANATHACICEVDPVSFRVEIRRYVVSSDCGVVINPAVVEGQIAGGVVQGLGGVLYEHFVYDPIGNPQCSTFMDYLLPTATEVPDIEFAHIETPARGPGGYKGVGEGGAIASPAAIINAVADALQLDLLRQPLDPASLFQRWAAAQTWPDGA